MLSVTLVSSHVSSRITHNNKNCWCWCT